MASSSYRSAFGGEARGGTAMNDAFESLLSVLDRPLFTVHGVDITPLRLVLFMATILASVALGRLARRALIRVMLHRSEGQSEGSAYAVARISQYAITVAGALLALENVGISMTSLAALGAVFAVGLGFGLQNIAQNFISGLILLFERPISKGDVVIVDNTFGIVDEISIRATRIMTFDQIAMIVPNSKLISGVVENRSEPTTTYRIRIDVGVAYGSDTRNVEHVLLRVASGCRAVLTEPPPSVFFVGFGESSLDFQLCVWLDDPQGALGVGSDLRHAIVAAFAEEKVTIPFPQRDVHFDPAVVAPRQKLQAPAPHAGGVRGKAANGPSA